MFNGEHIWMRLLKKTRWLTRDLRILNSHQPTLNPLFTIILPLLTYEPMIIPSNQLYENHPHDGIHSHCRDPSYFLSFSRAPSQKYQVFIPLSSSHGILPKISCSYQPSFTPIIDHWNWMLGLGARIFPSSAFPDHVPPFFLPTIKSPWSLKSIEIQFYHHMWTIFPQSNPHDIPKYPISDMPSIAQQYSPWNIPWYSP